jgi:4-hydroxybenzoate polyprenyltransferase
MPNPPEAIGPMRLTRGLVGSCHPIPTLAVTAISAGLAALAGDRLGRGVLLTLAVFAGQLSIGWSNDRIDAARDRAVDRSDKPLAAGALPLAAVTIAAATALVVAVVLSLALGYRAGIAALVIVACGWLYNLGLKATAWSWLPYALAFGTLPAVATLALPGHPWPAAWAVLAGALLGVSAHFANVLPDLVADAATGVRGLPHRLGARTSVIVGPVLLLAATASIVFGVGQADGAVSAADWGALAAAAVVAVIAITAGWRRPAGRTFFLAVLLVAVTDIVLFGLSGGRLR